MTNLKYPHCDYPITEHAVRFRCNLIMAENGHDEVFNVF